VRLTTCLLLYPEINIYDKTRAGGVAHLIANIEGYNQNGIRCFVIGAFHPCIVTVWQGNLLLNIVYWRTRIPLKRESKDGTQALPLNKPSAMFIKKILNLFYKEIVTLTYKLLKPRIVHERATDRFSFISQLRRYKASSFVYEVNDYSYDARCLISCDIALVTDSSKYPTGPHYFSRPWPVVVRPLFHRKKRKQNRIVYLGTGAAWHDFNQMVEIIKILSVLDQQPWRLDVYGSESIRRLTKNVPETKYKGFVQSYDIPDVLSAYQFGFAIYNQFYGQKRNLVGSPMKVIYYLYYNVVPVVNICNDNEMLSVMKNTLIIHRENPQQTAALILETRSRYEELLFNKEWLNSRYSPSSYYGAVLKSISTPFQMC